MSNNLRNNQGMMGGLCTPAKLYGIVSLVGVAGLLFNRQFLGAIGQGLFAAIWVFVLNWICSEGWTGLSWFLVLLPVILVVILIMAGAAMAVAEAEVPHERRRGHKGSE